MPIYKQSVNVRWTSRVCWNATWRVQSTSGHLWRHKWPGYNFAG